jgi:hypothetical protein
MANPAPLATDVVGARPLGFQAQAVRHLGDADHLRIGETDLEHMIFPALHLDGAVGAFSTVAYGDD